MIGHREKVVVFAHTIQRKYIPEWTIFFSFSIDFEIDEKIIKQPSSKRPTTNDDE